jgi:hypothetical protein
LWNAGHYSRKANQKSREKVKGERKQRKAGLKLKVKSLGLSLERRKGANVEG